jgi:hypothetical protein
MVPADTLVALRDGGEPVDYDIQSIVRLGPMNSIHVYWYNVIQTPRGDARKLVQGLHCNTQHT